MPIPLRSSGRLVAYLKHAALAVGVFVVVVGLVAGVPILLFGDHTRPRPDGAEPSQASVETAPASQPASTEDDPSPLDDAIDPEELGTPAPTELVAPPAPEIVQKPPVIPFLFALPVPAAEAKPKPADVAPAARAAPAETRPLTVRERWMAKRRSRLTDEELRRQLLLAAEADLEAVPGTTKRVISLSPKAIAAGQDVVPGVAVRRTDLAGLPLHTGTLARMSLEEALNLKVLSQRLRLAIQTAIPGQVDNVVDPRPDPAVLRQQLLNSPLQAMWLRPQAISTIRQLLMSEHRNARLVMVDLLAKIDGGVASLALAERAVFDLDQDIRLAAILALEKRPAAEYEPALLNGLRYPWAPAADHAAEALVALNHRGAVPKLVALLDARGPSEPFTAGQGKFRQTVGPEVVRINHLKNCLLCHAYSGSAADPVRGLVPHAEHLVPLPSSGTRTVTRGGWGGGAEATPKVSVSTFVRPDITFLRQDFSVVQPVANHGKLWPADQRFDYLVRLRPLGNAGLAAWHDRLETLAGAVPQRESALFALRELAGEDLGPSTDAWLRAYSPVTGRRLDKPLDGAERVRHLRDTLFEAGPTLLTERLATFRDKSGAVYDTALAQAIPLLKADGQKAARAVLVDRLFALSSKAVALKLTDGEAEVRRAAVAVCKQRKLRSLVPDLIARLDDASPEVVNQVHDLLLHFTSRDFGPARGADKETRHAAMQAWRDWWEQQKQERAGQKGA